MAAFWMKPNINTHGKEKTIYTSSYQWLPKKFGTLVANLGSKHRILPHAPTFTKDLKGFLLLKLPESFDLKGNQVPRHLVTNCHPTTGSAKLTKTDKTTCLTRNKQHKSVRELSEKQFYAAVSVVEKSRQ